MILVYRIHVLVAPSVDGDIVLIVFIDGGITLYLHRIISGFHGAFATDVACHQYYLGCKSHIRLQLPFIKLLIITFHLCLKSNITSFLMKRHFTIDYQNVISPWNKMILPWMFW